MRLSSYTTVGAHTAKLWQGDAVEMMKSMPKASVDLIVTSPPYFIGKEYDTSFSAQDFIKEVRRVLPQMLRVLKAGGSLCWQIGNHVHNGNLIPLDALVVGALSSRKSLQLRNRIIWTFEHGAHSSRRFSGRHETILWYTKGREYLLNLDQVRVPQKYPGKRHYKGPNKGEWSGNPLGKNPGDVWEVGDVWKIPNVKANHVEKTEHPCQFPIALVRRLIVALSPPGGTVMDPYVGSGTTAVSALLDGRNFVGSDLEAKYLRVAAERLDSLSDGDLQIREDVPVHVPNGRESVAIRPAHFRSVVG